MIPVEDLLRIESSVGKLSIDRAHFVSPKNGSSLRGLRKATKKPEEVMGMLLLDLVVNLQIIFEVSYRQKP